MSAKQLLRQITTAFPKSALPFLGLGIYRAWISVALNHNMAATTQFLTSQDIFDTAMLAVLILCAYRAPKAPSFLDRSRTKLVALCLLILSTGCIYLGYFAAPSLTWVSILGSVLGGAGIGYFILLWSELYSTLSPVRICLYYTASLALCVIVVWIYNGFHDPWLPVMTALLPLISYVLLSESSTTQVETGIEVTHSWMRFSFPWRPVLFVALFTLAYGLEQGQFHSGLPRAHESMGTLICCLLVVLSIIFARKWCEFGTIYGSWLPLMAAVFLALPATGALSPSFAAASACWGYAANEIFVMTMVGSIAYRYGANPIWLFGIERSVRAAVLMAARALSAPLAASTFGIAPVVIMAVLIATFIALSQNKLDALWGVALVEDRLAQNTPEQEEALRLHNLSIRIRELARRYALSQREEEVLLLLAQHKTTADIERELVIANGTAKAHTRHVYAKLDIHSREELFALVSEITQHSERHVHRASV